SMGALPVQNPAGDVVWDDVHVRVELTHQISQWLGRTCHVVRDRYITANVCVDIVTNTLTVNTVNEPPVCFGIGRIDIPQVVIQLVYSTWTILSYADLEPEAGRTVLAYTLADECLGQLFLATHHANVVSRPVTPLTGQGVEWLHD